jgi:hypothetical protein
MQRHRWIAPVAVKQALHIGEKSDELDVMTVAKLRRIWTERFRFWLPGAICAGRLHEPPMLVDFPPVTHRHQLQGPEQYLAKAIYGFSLSIAVHEPSQPDVRLPDARGKATLRLE